MPSSTNRDCAYTNGFPVMASGCDVVTLQTSATNGSMSFLLWEREGLWLAGYVGFKPCMAQTHRHKATATWGRREVRELLQPKASMTGEGGHGSYCVF